MKNIKKIYSNTPLYSAQIQNPNLTIIKHVIFMSTFEIPHA